MLSSARNDQSIRQTINTILIDLALKLNSLLINYQF